MKNLKIVCLIIVFCSSQLFVQCASDDNNKKKEKTETEQYTDEVIMLRNFLSTSLPMDINKIIYDSSTSSFIIDKDVVMPLEQARDHYSSHSGLKTQIRLINNQVFIK